MTTSPHLHPRTALRGGVAAVVLAIALSVGQLAYGFALVALLLSVPALRARGAYLKAPDGRISLVRLIMAGGLVGAVASSAAVAGHYAAGFTVGFLHGIFA